MITLVGLGEIGAKIYSEFKKRNLNVYGVEKDTKKIETYKRKGLKVGTSLKKSDTYIICLYSTSQVLDLIDEIDKKNNPLIIIESTLNIGTTDKILKKYPDLELVLFPHRYNKGDRNHQLFNLQRVMGASSDCALKKALKFYSQFMDLKLIHTTDLKIVELCKPLENAIRYLEIALAEELKLLSDGKGIDFDILRTTINTKWNINLKEARDGIKGKCLPKDINIINTYFDQNQLFELSLKINQRYEKEYIKNKQSNCKPN